jgi:RNA polymerase sigma-70 factor (ECF subfamily)
MPDFEQHRPYLWSIAYRMLGSVAEAEDIVQEAYLRSRNGPEPDSERAYLSKIVTRLCLDHWKSARVRRESYVGPWLPEPVRTESEQPVDPSSLSMAFMVLLESLSPVERAVYLLSEVFDYSHAEVARIVGESEATCRKQLQRAREHVVQHRPRFTPSREQHDRLLHGFAAACQQGDLPALERLLAADVVNYADGGGKVHAGQIPVVGAKLVLRLYNKLFKTLYTQAQFEIAQVNGQSAVLVRSAGMLLAIIDLETDADRIVAIRVLVNPDKLAALMGS